MKSIFNCYFIIPKRLLLAVLAYSSRERLGKNFLNPTEIQTRAILLAGVRYDTRYGDCSCNCSANFCTLHVILRLDRDKHGSSFNVFQPAQKLWLWTEETRTH